MKPLNDLKFIAKVSLEIEGYKELIHKSQSLEDGKQYANRAIGCIDCVNTYCSCMIHVENNYFTSDLDALTDLWMAEIFGELANLAVEMEADKEEISRLYHERDRYRERANEI